MTLKRGIFIILQANIIALFINILTNFFLPKYLSVEAYASIKTFQLYITYIGLLHFGYADGMYLKYGGISARNISKAELAADIQTIKYFQILVSFIAIIISFLFHDIIWFAFSMSILPLNMASYYKLLCQATGEFKKYSSIMNMTTIFTFAINVFLLFIIRENKDAILYITAYILLSFFIWVKCENIIVKAFDLKGVKGHFKISLLKQNVLDGILLLLGNFSTAFLTGMDRWFVKCLMNTTAFAQYSFAVSIENFMYVAVTPISVTLYNFLGRNSDIEKIRKIKGMVYILAVILPACVFPLKWILEKYLEKYLEASGVLFLLFATQIFAAIVKCIYVNLYKVYRKQKIYFIKLVCVISLGFILNMVCYYFYNSKEAFAVGTLVSHILWFIISVLDFPEVFPTFNEGIYIILELILFLTTGYFLTVEIGFLVYVIGTIVLTLLLMNKYVKYGLELVSYNNSKERKK